MAADVERVILEFPGVAMTKVVAKANPITGHHVEATVQSRENTHIEKTALITFLKAALQPHMVPRKIKLSNIEVGHRFKKL